MQEATQMQVYVRRWRPSSCTVDCTTEIILDQNSPEHLKAKLAEISGLPSQDIQYAKVGVACVILLLSIPEIIYRQTSPTLKKYFSLT